MTSNTLDKATALLPALLNERLPELGIDFALMYPSFGLSINAINQDDLCRAAARAHNMMTADMFAPFAARFAPVAIIPEAFEMVEKRFMTAQDFREFTFTNAARLHTRNNPDFFKGAVVGQAVADEPGPTTPLQLVPRHVSFAT